MLHFLLLGALLFLAHGWLNPPEEARPRIVVGGALLEGLARQHEAVWMRPPTPQELDGLVQSHVRDEILYREGLALGLDRDDPVIRRRVRQKLEVMAEEQLTRAAPSDAELSAYLAENAARFSQPGELSFEQILLEDADSASQAEQDLLDVRAALAGGAAPSTLGQRSLLPQAQERVPLDLVARDFGQGFAEELARLPLFEWSGPVVSGFGSHLVRVSERSPATAPSLEAVRQQVAREWEHEQRERSLAEHYQELLSRYEVVVEPALPTGPAEQP